MVPRVSSNSLRPSAVNHVRCARGRRRGSICIQVTRYPEGLGAAGEVRSIEERGWRARVGW